MDLKAVLSLRMARTQQEIISTEEAATKEGHTVVSYMKTCIWEINHIVACAQLYFPPSFPLQLSA